MVLEIMMYCAIIFLAISFGVFMVFFAKRIHDIMEKDKVGTLYVNKDGETYAELDVDIFEIRNRRKVTFKVTKV